MDGYPDSEDEFELMYGDELDAFKDLEGKTFLGYVQLFDFLTNRTHYLPLFILS